MRILAVIGSPRKRGNTETLVDAFLEGARVMGAETEKVYLADLDIAPCDACDGCRSAGECVRGDDMIPLYEKLFAADLWLLGTPVYWWGPSGWMKAFIDRWYAFDSLEPSLVKGKAAVLVSAFADADPGTARHLVGMLSDAFDYLKMNFAAQLLVTADSAGEVARNTAALDEARELGRRLAGGC